MSRGTLDVTPGRTHAKIPPPQQVNPPNLPELVEIAYRAADELSENQAAYILEQLYGDGYEWGLSSDIDVTSPEEPCSFAEAMASPEAPKWLAACTEELNSIKNLGVFRLVPHNAATGRTIMDRKIIFKLKRDENGLPIRWKARFVVKGYAAIYGVDYNETTAPTMRMETFRAVELSRTSLPPTIGFYTNLTSKRLSFRANLNLAKKYI
jgi:hypothetical protein